MSYLDRAETRLRQIREAGRYREIGEEGRPFAADFSSNDYLGLAADSRMIEAMRVVRRVGSGGARLLGGRHREHRLLEEEIARWVGRERALLFSSGYLAAIGAVTVLAQTVDAIYSDRLNHASLIDGIRSCRLPREIYPHARLPPRGLRRRSALIVSESLFGMDGDRIDPARMRADLGESDVLLLDEAHALGVVGAEGSGLASGIDDPRIVVIGTLSKAIGATGGFVAGPAPLIDLMINAARTFIFDTALPPPIAFAARVGITLARKGDDLRARLFARSARLRDGLAALGYDSSVQGPIFPIVLGGEERALAAMRCCAEGGVNAPAIRPPTVPEGSSRLRITLRADQKEAEIDLLLERLTACGAFS